MSELKRQASVLDAKATNILGAGSDGSDLAAEIAKVRAELAESSAQVATALAKQDELELIFGVVASLLPTE